MCISMERAVVFENSSRKGRRGACVDVGCRIDAVDVMAGQLLGLTFSMDQTPCKNPALAADNCLYPGFCHLHCSSARQTAVRQQAQVLLQQGALKVGADAQLGQQVVNL